MIRVYFSFKTACTHTDLAVNTETRARWKYSHTYFYSVTKMEFTNSCPDAPVRENSVHLICTTSLISLHSFIPQLKGKKWLLNFTELNIKDSVEDKNQDSDPLNIFSLGTFYFIFPLVFLLCWAFFKFCQTLISYVKAGCKLSQACAILCVCVAPDSRMLKVMDAKSILELLLRATVLQTITTFPLVIRTYD